MEERILRAYRSQDGRTMRKGLLVSADVRRAAVRGALGGLLILWGAAPALGRPASSLRPPTWLHARSSAQYIWTSIPTLDENNWYQTPAFLFRRSGSVEVRPDAGPRPYTHFEFYACLITADDRPTPPKGYEPPGWNTLHGRDRKARAEFTVNVLDEKGRVVARLAKQSISRLYTEERVTVQLPADFVARRHTIRIQVDPESGTRALVYRLAAWARKGHPTRVLLISLDTHALQHMSLFRPKEIDTSPSLRRLIREDSHAVAFSGAMAVSNWTLPTHATVFTGLYPTEHGVINREKREGVRRDVSTLPELIQPTGAVTVHLASRMWLTFRYGYNRGVDYYRQYGQPLGQRGRATLNDAHALLAGMKDRDVFLFVHLFDAHRPYTNLPSNYRSYHKGVEPISPRSLYEGELYTQEIYRSGGWDPRRRAENVREYGEFFGERTPAARAAYRLGLRDVDDMLGAFLNGLKHDGLYDDTTIIFFGDHGEEFFGHGLLGHTSLYHENVNVPFIIKLSSSSAFAKRLDAGRKEIPFYFEADTTLFRVVLDLFSVAYPSYLEQANTEAVSLSELLTLSGNHRAFSEFYVAPWDTYHESSMVFEDGHKVILSSQLTNDYQWRLKNEYVQVFDLKTDPANATNLFVESDPALQALREQVIQKAIAIRNLQFEPEHLGGLTEQEREKLRSLGYLQ